MATRLATSPGYEGPRPILDMTQDFTMWKHQIRQAIDGLCAIGGAHRQEGDSFSEAMQPLYGDSHFAEFLSYQGWRQAGLTDAAADALVALKQQLDNYDEPGSDAAIAADPEWQGILMQVNTAMALLA